MRLSRLQRDHPLIYIWAKGKLHSRDQKQNPREACAGGVNHDTTLDEGIKGELAACEKLSLIAGPSERPRGPIWWLCGA